MSGLKWENVFFLATLSTTDTWRERQRFKNHESGTFKCQRPYHIEHTSSRPTTEVKQCWVQSVLWWVTAWEHLMLLATLCFGRFVGFFVHIFVHLLITNTTIKSQNVINVFLFLVEFSIIFRDTSSPQTRRLLRDLSTYGLGTLLELLNWYISKSSLLSLMLYTCEDYWRSCEPILACLCGTAVKMQFKAYW